MYAQVGFCIKDIRTRCKQSYCQNRACRTRVFWLYVFEYKQYRSHHLSVLVAINNLCFDTHLSVQVYSMLPFHWVLSEDENTLSALSARSRFLFQLSNVIKRPTAPTQLIRAMGIHASDKIVTDNYVIHWCSETLLHKHTTVYTSSINKKLTNLQELRLEISVSI